MWGRESGKCGSEGCARWPSVWRVRCGGCSGTRRFLRRRMRFAPQSKPMSGDARSVALFAALGGEGSAHAFLSSVILVCVGASPPSICKEPSSALFYFLSISFPFLLSNAVGVPSHCDRSTAASVAVRGGDCHPSMKSAGSLSCCRFCVVSDAVRGWLLCVCLPMEGGVSCCRFFAAVAGCRAEGGCCAVASR